MAKINKPVSIVIGIDPGNAGGIFALDLKSEPRGSFRMPVIKGKRTTMNVPKICEVLRHLQATYRVRLVAIEKVGPRPGEGGVQAFAFGRGVGNVEGILAALGLASEQPLPQAWQQYLPSSVRRASVPKGASRTVANAAKKAFKNEIIAAASRRWPDGDFIGSDHSSATETSGLADAAWIAEWARRQLVGAE